MELQTVLTEHRRNKQRGFPKGVSGNPSRKFTTFNQPSPDAKVAGKLKKRRGRELVGIVLDLCFRGKQNSHLKQQAAEYFQLPEQEITVEIMLLLKQAERAIQKADTHAFSALMDRAYGKPSQIAEVDHTSTKTFYDFLRESSRDKQFGELS